MTNQPRTAFFTLLVLLGSCANDNDANGLMRWRAQPPAMIEEVIEEDHDPIDMARMEEPAPSTADDFSFPEPDPTLRGLEPGSLPTWTDEEVQVERTKVAASLDALQAYPYRYDQQTRDSIAELLDQDEELRSELVSRGLETIRPLWSEAHMTDFMEQKLMEGPLVRPVDGVVTSQFGQRFHPIYEEYRLHSGTDFGEPSGEPVTASGSGKVYFAGDGGGYGNLIKVDHGDGVTSYYAHLSEFRVGLGDAVLQGQHIGDVGSTGNSTGPHLHFEVRIDGAPKNPMDQIGSR